MDRRTTSGRVSVQLLFGAVLTALLATAICFGIAVIFGQTFSRYIHGLDKATSQATILSLWAVDISILLVIMVYWVRYLRRAYRGFRDSVNAARIEICQECLEIEQSDPSKDIVKIRTEVTDKHPLGVLASW